MFRFSKYFTSEINEYQLLYKKEFKVQIKNYSMLLNIKSAKHVYLKDVIHVIYDVIHVFSWTNLFSVKYFFPIVFCDLSDLVHTNQLSIRAISENFWNCRWLSAARANYYLRWLMSEFSRLRYRCSNAGET